MLDPARGSPLCSQLFCIIQQHQGVWEPENQTALAFLQAWRPPSQLQRSHASDCASSALEQCPGAALWPDTHPATAWGKHSQTSLILPPQAAEPCGRADVGPPLTLQVGMTFKSCPQWQGNRLHSLQNSGTCWGLNSQNKGTLQSQAIQPLNPSCQ